MNFSFEELLKEFFCGVSYASEPVGVLPKEVFRYGTRSLLVPGVRIRMPYISPCTPKGTHLKLETTRSLLLIFLNQPKGDIELQAADPGRGALYVPRLAEGKRGGAWDFWVLGSVGVSGK